MPIRVSLQHRTSYRYDRLTHLSPQVIRMRPAPHCRTPILGYSLSIQPKDHFLNWQQDPHGNWLARAVFSKPVRQLTLEVNLVAEMSVINPFDFFLDEEVESFPFQYADWLTTELAAYRATLPVGPLLRDFLTGFPKKMERTVDFLVAANHRVHQAVSYVIRLEPGVQTCEETLEKGTGSCRDSAWLLVQAMRNMGLAARFVSGYLIQLAPDEKSLDGPSGTDVDFTDLHAWAEIYLPGAGWVGLDPTSGLLTGEGHLPLAATPEPLSAAPLTGLTSECETEFEFSMNVKRVHEDPRVTKPYTDEQWSRIEAVGQQVDAQLTSQDVRLTMGGEPTFVSRDDMEGAEWITAALGPDKRRLAGQLLLRLADRFSQGPLLHYGLGKWYPGEPLPRWALGCYWRLDGLPMWRDARLIARDDAAYAFNSDDAALFAHRLAEMLEVGEEHVIPAYEDAFYYIWKERRLPANVDPFDSELSDELERARLARIFEQGLKHVVGYAMPLRPRNENAVVTTWESGPWFLRSERMYLLPGDSPMGLRLPLDSLLHSLDQEPEHYTQARDPFAPREALTQSFYAAWQREAASSATNVAVQHRSTTANWTNGAGLPDSGVRSSEPPEYAATGMWTPGEDRDPHRSDQRSQAVRTAVCVEARQGMLHVFMPPLGHLENYVALVNAVERTAAVLDMPVRIEGYAPQHDTRMTHLKVTPDPGVIEVNMQPLANWRELVHSTSALYEEARLCRLGTEKFMLDGRHTGTGGGNHLVLGGRTPQDSPFLRRPDLLKSLITYWNNRPSLSYLFSGLFVGPTSQAPRVDEARHESLYELETAFCQLATHTTTPPWLVDRVLRNLLIDVTGNTHRAEFCIDKLFSPDSSAGRLGLVEFRAFEMPPHARMSLAQQLLLRALIARFWQQPYEQPLVRWGAALHDRFMLPHFVAHDFAEVIEDLNAFGFAFEQDWFAAHFEFRFPFIGRITKRNMELEVRQAIEPWHVLGEEGAAAGTVRYVDSSLERVQVKLRGMTDSRHVLVCNGRRVPLHRTETPGEFVAGIRFRAWQPPSCLHPTIPVHAPLALELHDTWSGTVLGGCTWHVSHPGGVNPDRFPVNSYEAESRRGARFFAFGNRSSPSQTPPAEVNRDYPLTLDLRRPVEFATLNDSRAP